MFWRILLWVAALFWGVAAWLVTGPAADHAQTMAAIFLVGAVLADELKKRQAVAERQE